MPDRQQRTASRRHIARTLPYRNHSPSLAVVIPKAKRNTPGSHITSHVGNSPDNPIVIPDDSVSKRATIASPHSTLLRVKDIPHESSGLTCPICWENTVDGLVAVGCGHVCHQQCFSQYIRQYFESRLLASGKIQIPCPLCRADCIGRLERCQFHQPLHFVVVAYSVAVGRAKYRLPSSVSSTAVLALPEANLSMMTLAAVVLLLCSSRSIT
ncbi:hypothetical protein ASPWEDRAFT_304194 [Aspergillus wentii DTO 134E9]|uniref:RING-type domain-containing protein n=1 Tax=Aspergillus wentii DTO 134E9 TaxID=1073089 RepID=A0A1L9R3Y1_ASPWE|nr:uncharacterized protein ASPWEDRAFT_304194 [Aspergillus wentii DTO 134E9]OJJ29614.1 hypothetical protein ASPWEDRAFT_304194 [Aspergillus wentii DTO 134E9]